jgi:hypothetical protein
MIPELLDLLACLPLECAYPPFRIIDFCCSCFCPSLSSLSQLPCEGVIALSNLLTILILIGIGLELLIIGILFPLVNGVCFQIIQPIAEKLIDLFLSQICSKIGLV